ncbi:triose-phosphate transporter family-domain-containing protein [Alternaria rosae]|uniref:triose-phosphate transporter family-domain-containing protein n=1 Tax=Alternaria rosae TaxID=1187941 RepID=UPI001E8E7EB7|nr:triose-phosphate transporter family-domain-containing protein [Alternaria rosae]KAH6872756.1 triose-phosphate transporter family-domain-containing protein [Alternaria rosae]
MEKIEMAQAEPVSKQAAESDEQYPIELELKENEPLLDLESQQDAKHVLSQRPTEPAASRTKTFIYLATYFIMNLSLTFYNKAVMGSFPFPWILTAVHTGSAALGSSIFLMFGHFQLTRLTPREHLVHFMFSLLFTLNIAMSNLSLAMVSVPFHQIMRATCPLFTILIYRVIFSRRYALITYLSIVPVMLGVGLATFGDYYFTAIGFTLTLIGVVLAAVKTVVTNRLMTGRLRLPALELLLRMGPLAAVQSLLYSVLIGEFSEFLEFVNAGHLTRERILTVSGNGLLAFGLNVASFETNKLAGALTLTICANLKQCLTIVLGAFLWDVPVSPMNGAGILLALAGGAWYSSIELKSKARASG